MWLGYPGTSGASFMDYIITDAMTSPTNLAYTYSEKLAFIPHTFFVGDHMQMFAHMTERAILKGKDKPELERDNVTVVNSLNLEAITELADVNVKVFNLHNQL